MYVITVKEVEDPKDVKSSEVSFKSSWEAECFIYDCNIKKVEHEGREFFKMIVFAFLVFLIPIGYCMMHAVAQDIHKMATNIGGNRGN